MTFRLPMIGTARRMDDAIDILDSDEFDLNSDPESCGVLVGTSGVVTSVTPQKVLMDWLADPARIEPLAEAMEKARPRILPAYRERGAVA